MRVLSTPVFPAFADARDRLGASTGRRAPGTERAKSPELLLVTNRHHREGNAGFDYFPRPAPIPRRESGPCGPYHLDAREYLQTSAFRQGGNLGQQLPFFGNERPSSAKPPSRMPPLSAGPCAHALNCRSFRTANVPATNLPSQYLRSSSPCRSGRAAGMRFTFRLSAPYPERSAAAINVSRGARSGECTAAETCPSAHADFSSDRMSSQAMPPPLSARRPPWCRRCLRTGACTALQARPRLFRRRCGP